MSLSIGLLAFDDPRYAGKAGSCPVTSRLAFWGQSFSNSSSVKQLSNIKRGLAKPIPSSAQCFQAGKEHKMSETDKSDTVRKVGTFIAIVLSAAIYVLAIGPLVYSYL